MNKKVDNICVMVEIDGQVCSVQLADNVRRMLPGIISSLSPDGAMKLVKLSKEYKFQDLTSNDVDPS